VNGATCIELLTTVVADAAGSWEIGASGLGSCRVEAAGRVIAEADLALPRGADVVEALMAPPQCIGSVELGAWDTVDVRVSLRFAAIDEAATMGPVMQLNVQRGLPSEDEAIAEAAAAAAGSDVAVVVVGTNEEVESEGFDRDSLALPGRQDELVRRVAAANPRTVVVVNSGAPVLLPWADEAAAVLIAWFPGQEFGGALADVLLGAVEPGGRLPTTWPLDEADLPSPTPVAGRLAYTEGPRIGYMDPARLARYAFGHGLGYTSWSYEGLEIHGPDQEGGQTAELDVRNMGARHGREVVQVYVSRPGSAMLRPVRRLAGFAAVTADPGESRRVRIAIPRRAFEHWDPGSGGWAIEPGAFRVEVGRSSADLPLAGEVVVPRTG
jgi:beta-glucosidase